MQAWGTSLSSPRRVPPRVLRGPGPPSGRMRGRKKDKKKSRRPLGPIFSFRSWIAARRARVGVGHLCRLLLCHDSMENAYGLCSSSPISLQRESTWKLILCLEAAWHRAHEDFSRCLLLALGASCQRSVPQGRRAPAGGGASETMLMALTVTI